MKLQLTTWQRIVLYQIVGQLRGPVSLVRTASKLLDVLEMSEADRTEVGYRELPNGAATWRDPERRLEIENADREAAALLRRTVEQHQEWPAGQARQVLDLAEQLGLDLDEEGDDDG